MNKYKLYMIIGISSLVLSIGTTFAYYIWKSSTNAIVNLNICTPTITFAGGSTINGVDMIPVLTKEEGTIKDIEVKKNSTCNKDVTMNLYLELTTFPTELAESSFVYELYKNSETMAIASGNFANKKEGDTVTLLSNQILNTSKDTYTLYIYIDGNVDNPGTMAGKNFLFKLWGSGEGAIYKENVITTPDSATGSTSKFFNTEVMREEIQSLTIAEDNTVPDTPGVVSKDISQNQDGTVMLWYTPKEVASSDGSTKTMYDMWIGGENGVLQTGTNASGMFAYLTNIEKLDLSKLDTSYITNMSKMFYMSSGLKSIDLSNFNTSNVTNMNGMFWGCSSLPALDLKTFNTSKVTDMNNMFAECSNITTLDLSNFDTSNVLYMGNPYSYSYGGMFRNCKSLKSLDLSSFDTSKVKGMSNMFQGCSSLTTLDLSNFDTSNVTAMASMFATCTNLTSLNLTSFNTSKVTNMQGMFYGCSSLTTLDLSNFNTNNVTDMSLMFRGCSSLTTLDLSSFNTGSVTNMVFLFYGCSNLTTLDLSNFNTDSVINMLGMFNGCSSLTSLDLSSFNTSSVTNMKGMFSYCSSLTNLNLSNFDTSNVINMEEMFRNCTSLVSLNLSSFNTSKVTSTWYMFMNCSKIMILDLSSFDTSSVTYMDGMFYLASSLKTIYASDLWNTSKVTGSTNMFGSCSSLQGKIPFDSTKTDISMANYTTGYLTYKSNN